MTTAKKAKAEIIVTAPKVESAWRAICDTTNSQDSDLVKYLHSLATELGNSQLSTRDLQKVIKATGVTSSRVSVTQVPKLVTWQVWHNKSEEFRGMAINKQLSLVSGAYDILGVESAKGIATLDALKAEVKAIRATKKGKAEKPAKPAKKGKATTAQALADTIRFIATIDPAKLSESESRLFDELFRVVEEKAELVTLA